MLDRRRFLLAASLAGAGLAVPTFAQLPETSGSSPAPAPPAKPKKERPPALAPDLVREFVGAGHGNLDRVKEMLAAEPGLLNATWDWGGGDFETALGGAGHTGRADIAELLLSRGARMDVFVAAMLGRLDVVKAVLEAIPEARTSRGPHGISLEAHARAGGDRARAVLAWLGEGAQPAGQGPTGS